jgi:acetyl-CoA acetyltransferase
MPVTERPVALVGAGCTQLSRTPEKTEVDLAVEACRAAADDAGLDPADIDGINIQVHHYPLPDTQAIAGRLGMKEVRWTVDGGLGVGALARAAQAIDAGSAQAVVVCKIMNTIAPVNTPLIDPLTGGIGGDAQFDVPFGLGYTMQRVGLMKRRWMERFGITDEQVGWLCVTQREHALLNPVAIFKKPLTIEEYVASKWIADPIHVFDCDYPVNGAFAYVLTRDDIADRLSQPPVYLRGWSGTTGASMIPHLLPEGGRGLSPYATELYADTGLKPADMDVWMLYDGFSFLVMQWMEELGLVPPGQSGAYVDGGTRIRFDGEHPVNTHGGQLSEGRLHATGHLLEAMRQIRGTAGGRQAKKADHAIVSSAYPYAGAVAIFGK